MEIHEIETKQIIEKIKETKCYFFKKDLKSRQTFDRFTKKKERKTQINMLQMKEQGKNLQDQINEEEIGKLPEKEFRVISIIFKLVGINYINFHL